MKDRLMHNLHVQFSKIVCKTSHVVQQLHLLKVSLSCRPIHCRACSVLPSPALSALHCQISSVLSSPPLFSYTALDCSALFSYTALDCSIQPHPLFSIHWTLLYSIHFSIPPSTHCTALVFLVLQEVQSCSGLC